MARQYSSWEDYKRQRFTTTQQETGSGTTEAASPSASAPGVRMTWEQYKAEREAKRRQLHDMPTQQAQNDQPQKLAARRHTATSVLNPVQRTTVEPTNRGNYTAPAGPGRRVGGGESATYTRRAGGEAGAEAVKVPQGRQGPLYGRETQAESATGRTMRAGENAQGVKLRPRDFVGPLGDREDYEERQESRLGNLPTLEEYAQTGERRTFGRQDPFQAGGGTQLVPPDITGPLRQYEQYGPTAQEQEQFMLGLEEFIRNGQARDLTPRPESTQRVGSGEYGVDISTYDALEVPEDDGDDRFIHRWQQQDEAAQREREWIESQGKLEERQRRMDYWAAIPSLPDYEEVAAQGRENWSSRMYQMDHPETQNMEGRVDTLGYELYTYATEDEKKTYAYILQTEGKESADEYLRTIETRLNEDMAAWQLETIEKAPAALKPIIYFGASGAGGVEQTWKGYQKTFELLLHGDETAIPASAQQMVNAELQRILNERSGWSILGKGWKQALFNLNETTLAQLPTMIAGAAGGGSIATLGPMALSVYGNTYSDQIAQGRTPREAKTLAAISATVEILTEKIGGVGFLSGGTWTEEALSTWISSCDSALGRFAMNMASSAIGEGVEEMVSGILDPIAEAFVTYQNMSAQERLVAGVQDINWEEVLYEGLMGAASGVVMGGPTTAVQLHQELTLQNEAQDAGRSGMSEEEFRQEFADEEEGVPTWAMDAFKRGMEEYENEEAKQAGRTGLSLEALEQRFGVVTDAMRAAFENGRREAQQEERTQAAVASAEEQTAPAEEQAAQEEEQPVPELSQKIIDRQEAAQERADLEERQRAVEENAAPEATEREAPQEEEDEGAQIRRQAAEIAAETVASEEASDEEKTAVVAQAMQAVGVEGDVQAQAEAVVAMANGDSVDPAVRDAIAANDDAAEFARTVVEQAAPRMRSRSQAYNYGVAGLSIENLETVSGEVTDEMRAQYEKGRAKARELDQRRGGQIASRERSGRAQKRTGTTRDITAQEAEKYGVRVIEPKNMSKRQRAAGKALDYLSKATGVNFVLYESQTGDLGEHTGRNGWWDNKTQTAYIDIASGSAGEEAMLRTASHELTHFIENWSPDQYNGLRDFLVEFYHGKGADVLPGLIADEIEAARDRGQDMDERSAMHEVTANAFEMMLSDPEAIRTLAQQNTSLFVRMKLWLDSFIEKIRTAMMGVEPGEEAARILNEDMEAVRDAQRLWFDALSGASDNLRGRVLEELDTQIEEIRGQADPGTDFVLLPGTEFELIDYRNPERNPKRWQMRPRDLVAREATELALPDQWQQVNLQGETVTVSAQETATEEEAAVEEAVQEETQEAPETPEAPAAETAEPAQAEAEPQKAPAKPRKSLAVTKRAILRRILKNGEKSGRPIPAWEHNGSLYVTDGYRMVRLNNMVPGIEVTQDGTNRSGIENLMNQRMDPAKKYVPIGLDETRLHEYVKGGGKFWAFGGNRSGPVVDAKYLDDLATLLPGAQWYVSDTQRRAIDAMFAVSDDGEAILCPIRMSAVHDYDDIYAQTGGASAPAEPAAPARKTSAAFKKLMRSWAENEWVNAPQDGSEKAQRFADFAEKWYNAGRDGVRTIDVEQTESDLNYPPFLQNEFLQQGQKEAQTEVKRKATRAKKGAAARGERAEVPDNQPVGAAGNDGEGTVRVLDQLPSEVQQEAGGEERVLDDAAGGSGRVRPDVRRAPDTGAARMGSSGNPESTVDGDAAGTGNVSEENAEALTTEEAAEQKTAQMEAPAQNYHFDELDLPRGPKKRFEANVAAIETVRRIIAENRTATPEEQEILSKFVGWGALAEAFDPANKDWAKEYKRLKALLSEDEWNRAASSTQNAHYTDISVVKAMYKVLQGWGFRGGRMLEPSAGSGNFLGAMPADMARTVISWRAVELDPITGEICKALYPQARVEIKGFEDARIPDDSIDVAIGNPPFGKTAPFDKRYEKVRGLNLHNYFFAKAIDKVRPGGLVFFVTSSFTMDSWDDNFRKYMSQRADFRGAVRLPSNAFTENAGTQVVTDILVFQKRGLGARDASEPYFETAQVFAKERYVRVNRYYADHPEMILGTLSPNGEMYRRNTDANGNEIPQMTVESNGKPIGPQIEEALGKLDITIPYERAVRPEVAQEAAIRASRQTKENGYELKDGKVYVNKDGELQEVELKKEDADKLAGLLELRDLGRGLVEAQKMGIADIAPQQKLLNKAYDAFVRKYGYIHKPQNLNAIKGDPDREFIAALESWDADRKTGKKADIFTKRVYERVARPERAETVSEAVMISENETGGKMDLARVAELMNLSQGEARERLLEERQAFLDEDGNLISRGEYLSGYVRTKLDAARTLAEEDERYKANVEELEKIVPKDKTKDQIAVHMGESWIPTELYDQFVNEQLQNRYSWNKKLTCFRDQTTGKWQLNLTGSKLDESTRRRNRALGAADVPFTDIFEANMNGKTLILKVPGTDSKVVDTKRTAVVQERQNKLREEFKEWLFGQEDRAEAVLKVYNDSFRNYVNRQFDGAGFTVNGMNPDPTVQMRDYQAQAAQRIVQSGGNTLLAHCVGAGKTFTMAAAAMKLKELGLVKKPMFVVPKALSAQWGREFRKFFPAARILLATEKDFQPAGRREFISRIATNDFDAVIVSGEKFTKIEMSEESQREFLEEQLDQLRESLRMARAAQGRKGRSVKEIEKAVTAAEAKLKKISSAARDEGNTSFEDLGVDGIFVDEVHNYKNLYYTTSMQVSGLGNTKGAKKSADLLMKIRYLQKLNGGRGIVFATATPIMNSMVEMYTMQRYLQPEALKRYGIEQFDAWAAQFGQVTSEVMPKPGGSGFRVEKIFSRFQNMAELQRMFRACTDVITKLPDSVKLPKVRGGKHTIVECDASDYQKEYISWLGARADALSGNKLGLESTEWKYNFKMPERDNMLLVCSDGRKVALSQRLVDNSLDWGMDSKVYRCADLVAQEYEQDKENLGTQLIFCDLSVPHGQQETTEETSQEESGEAVDAQSGDVYNEIKRALVARGIKSKEIAFIHEFNSTEKKEQLSKLMNDGKIRVLIGSTSMMGVGLNVQKRVTAMHHLDCPWRPGDLEQRDGRGIRYGNIHEDVAIYNYVTVGTFDTRMWAKIEQKSHFISQVMNGNEEMDDIAGDEMGMSAAEIKAAASGNPLILEQVAVDRDIQRLEALKAGVEQEQKELRRKAETQREVVSVLERYLPMLNKDAKKAEAKDVSGDNFTATVDGKTYNDRKEAGTAILKLVNKNYVKSATDYKVNAFEERGARGNRLFKLGTMAGFDIVCDTHMNVGLEGDLVWMAKVTETPDGTMRSIAGKLKTMSDYAKSVPEQIRRATAEAETLEKKAENAFDQQKELDRLRRRQYEIEQILNPEGQTNFAEAQADTEEQSVEASERRETKSDRRILAEALESVAVNDAERDALARYKNNVERIDRLSDQLKEVNAEIKEKSFAKGKRDTARLAELNAKKQALENTISREDKTLLRLERSENLRRVLEVERKKVRAEERAAAQERLQRYRERSEMELEEVKQRARERYAKRVEVDAVTKLKADIAQRVNHMRKLLLQPTDKAYIPELAQGSIARLLDAIDFTSRRALRGGDPTRADMRLAQSMEAVRSLFQSTYDAQNMTSEEAVNDAFGAYIDLPQGFIQDMAAMTEAIRRETDKAIGDGGFTVNQMNSEQLENLKHILDTMFHALRTMNKTMADGFYDNVVQMASDGIWDAKQKGQIVKDSGARRWLEYEHTTPVYFFKRIGRAGISLFTGFKNGVKKLADHTEEIKEFVEQHVTEDEVRSWRKEIHEFKLNNGDTVRLPADYIMNMYNHSKREQAMGHYLGAGFRRLDITSAGTEQVDDGHNMDMADFQRIIDTLNERQRKVADDFRVFVGETGGEWGNEVSMRRFGARQYTEGANYWPIKVDTDYTNSDPSADTPQNADLYRLLNMGFTKRLVPKANNRILVGSMFDTFADHMAEMAQYNAFALPVLDAVKFLNYRETTQGRNGQRLVNSIKSVMRVAYGKGAVGYFTQFIKDVSGAGVTGQNEKIVGKLLRMRNRGAVAANLRVAALQPTAIARALNVMGARDLGLGTLKGLTPAKLRQNADEMEAASGIARWKKLGFYDANVGRSMREMFGTERTRAGSVLDKTLEKSMKLAETADRYTWSIIWEAAKQKALRANPALKNDNDALITAATEIFDDTIYKTQVVDSVLTRSQYMRNNEGWHKFFSSFMMEPVLTYNVLLDGIVETEEDARTLGSRKAAYEKHKGKLARAFAVYTVTATLAAMVEAVFEALRDDDDYETFGTKFRDAFAGNFLDDIVPFTKLPVISELWNGTKSILEAVGMNVYGYGSSNPISEIMDVAVKFIQVFRKRLASDNGYTWYGVLYNAAKIPQTVGGIPIANLMREGVALWNNTAAAWLGQRRIETYRTSDSVGAEEFVKAYMREERTRMDALLHAMSANGADVPGAITAAAKRYFQAGRLSEDDAADLLVLHGKATTRNEALLTVRKWETQARTGNSSAGDYARVYDLIENWDGAGLRTEIRELTNLGKKPKDIASGITGKFKPIYLAASAADKTRLKQHLIEAYKLLGYDMDAAMKKIAAWEDD